MPELELGSFMYRHTMTFLKFMYVDTALYTIEINFSFQSCSMSTVNFVGLLSQ